MGEIKGIYAAAVSILNDDLSLDVNKTVKHCENIINDGCHGAVLFGSTGQSQLIPLNEKIEMINFVSKNNKIKEKLIIGTGLNSLVENINFLEKIQKNMEFQMKKNISNWYTNFVFKF